MPVETEEIPCNFVGKFKVGDNLVFNAKMLCKLVEENEEGIFNKPIVLQVGSILEAALSEIIYRAQNFNREGVPKLAKANRRSIAGKKLDKFNTIIQILKKHKVLDGLGDQIYEDLHKIRKYRNKIHIQNNIEIVGVSHDEDIAFSDEIRIWALDLNRKVIRHLNNNLSRPEGIAGYVDPLEIPC